MTTHLEFTGMNMKRYSLSMGKKNILVENLISQGLLNAKGNSKTMKSHTYNPAATENIKKYVLAAYENINNETAAQIKMHNVKPICHEGCNGCCDEYFYVSRGEYLVIKEYLLKTGFDIEKLRQKAIAKKQDLLKLYSSEHKKLSDGNRDMTTIEYDKDVPKDFDCCLFQENKLCSIYPVRPIICRLFGISASYAQCGMVKAKLRNFFTGKISSKKILRHTVDIPYDNRYRENIDYYMNGDKKIASPPFPLFWWLTLDDLD